MINEIQELIKRNLKDFLIKFITVIYTKEEINEMFQNIDVLNKINKNKENKITYNDSILYTEDNINTVLISDKIKVKYNNKEITLQEYIDLVHPKNTAAICGEAICGITICGDEN